MLVSQLCIVLLPQARYRLLVDGGSVPPTLYQDCIKIARLAKLGQDNLYKSVLQCCKVEGGSTAPFTAYVKSLDSLVRQAQRLLQDQSGALFRSNTQIH